MTENMRRMQKQTKSWPNKLIEQSATWSHPTARKTEIQSFNFGSEFLIKDTDREQHFVFKHYFFDPESVTDNGFSNSEVFRFSIITFQKNPNDDSYFLHHQKNWKMKEIEACFSSWWFQKIVIRFIARCSRRRTISMHDTSCSVQNMVMSQQSIPAVGSSDRIQRNGKHDFDPPCWPNRGTRTKDGFVDTHGFCSRRQAVAAGTSRWRDHRRVPTAKRHQLQRTSLLCLGLDLPERLQLGNEACRTQQEVRRKSAQELLRWITHAHFRLVTGFIVPRDETPRTQCDAN